MATFLTAGFTKFFEIKIKNLSYKNWYLNFADTIQSQRASIQSTMKTDPEMILFKSQTHI